MPDKNGVLTPNERQKIQKWMEEKKGLQDCPSCHQRNFTLGDHLVAPQLFFGDGSVRIGGPSYPMFMAICSNCGYTSFFNSVISGVILDKPKDPVDTEVSEDGKS